MSELLATYSKDCPLVAILRGIEPAQAVAVGRTLVSNGISMIEVPLNSPDPFKSIEILASELGEEALIGAGTVLTEEDVERTISAGGRLVVSPNTNPDVIRRAAASDAVCLPGFLTPSEAFAALSAGASGLKLFPAEAVSSHYLKAIRAVLPRTTSIYPVGGITPDNMDLWIGSGASGFGLGSGLYKPGMSADVVGERARAYVAGLKTKAGKQ